MNKEELHRQVLRSSKGGSSWDNSVRKAQLRGLSIFTSTSSVAPCDDGDGASTPRTPSSVASDDGEEGVDHLQVQHVERLLSNGDFYTGLWARTRPHGTGKYLWTDSCMYEGEWHRGRTNGKGKFSWPSGATYEGEFKSGYLDGYGTFTGASGDTYRGYYSMNLKNGQGRRTYTNGDYYEGEWRNGVQDGHGRYVWKTGHEYNGDWKSGTISGKGTLVWANGNSYEGGWSAGVPYGKGQFRWADGSVYVGVWSENPDDRKGFYFPAAMAASESLQQRDPHEELGLNLGECKVCAGESVSILPSQKAVWQSSTRSKRSSGEYVRVSRRSSCGSAKAGGLWEAEGERGSDGGDRQLTRRGSVVSNGSGSGGGEGFGRSSISMQTRVPREVKKQGDTIRKGHKNYGLMLNLQLGIRHSVGKHAAPSSPDLKASAFDPKDKVWTKFPTEGSKYTPPHQSCEFKWKDYCPAVFRTLRKLFNVDPADYMLSICGDEALRELSSPGKSGSFFYLTHDDRYMIKTLKKAEVKVLLRMLPAYYNHVRAFENTLVTKFFGLHCVKLSGSAQKKVRFVIMGNLFCSEYAIHRRYDLKGSSLGRTTHKPESERDETTTLKDLDLSFIFRLQKAWFQEFHRQVDRDSEFLEQERIMDYSLLVGLHFRDVSFFKDPLLSEGSSDSSTMSEGTPRLSRSSVDYLVCDPQRWATIKLGVNMPARVDKLMRRSDADVQSIGDPTGEMYDVVLFFGIIDILQDYDISKKLEHAYKSIQYDPTSISAVDPKQYSRRFRDFIYKVFSEDT